MGAHMALRTGKDGQLGPSWRRGGAMGELHPGVAGVGVQGPEQDESGTASTGWVFFLWCHIQNLFLDFGVF